MDIKRKMLLIIFSPIWVTVIMILSVVIFTACIIEYMMRGDW